MRANWFLQYAENKDLELIFGDALLDIPIVNNDPWALAQKVGVTVLSDKNLLASYVDYEEGRVIAAVFNSTDPEHYSFDTVVDPKYQGQGLGTNLIQIAMDEYETLQEVYPELNIKLDVINPGIIPFLERTYNLEVTAIEGNHYIMEPKLNKTSANPGFKTYYIWNNQSIPEIIDRWANNNEQLYDPLHAESGYRWVHGFYPIEEVLPYREYIWTKEDARRTPEQWEELKDSLRGGWDTEEPISIMIGKNGRAKVGEGNHRLAVAQELIEEGYTNLANIPVFFGFWSSVAESPYKYPMKTPEEREHARQMYEEEERKKQDVPETQQEMTLEEDAEIDELMKLLKGKLQTKGQYRQVPPIQFTPREALWVEWMLGAMEDYDWRDAVEEGEEVQDPGPPPDLRAFSQTRILNINTWWLEDLVSRAKEQLPDMIADSIEWGEATNADYKVLYSIQDKLRAADQERENNQHE
jgi:GNAT superfamily N-acetyltransferase